MKFILTILILQFSILAENSHSGKVKEVILYKNGQALVMREVVLDLKEGSHEILITKLPNQIEPSSIYAEANGADVRAARIKTDELLEDNSDEIKKLNQDMEQTIREINKLNKLFLINTQNLAYLSKQEEFTIQNEKLEISKNVLNPETLKELTKFHFAERQRLGLEEVKLKEDLQNLNKLKDQQTRNRQQHTKTNLKNLEASIFLEKQNSGKVDLKIYYLVNKATWTPVYNFYAKENDKKIKVELNAIIEQLSGENWENINIILSNATKGLSSIPPSLSPFKVTLGASYQINDIKNQTQGIAKKMGDAYTRQSNSANFDESIQGSWELNKAANELQSLELIAKDDDLNVLKKENPVLQSSPVVNYAIKGKISLPSKKVDQIVKVDRFDLNGNFYNVAIPLLTNFIYREAEIENTSTEAMLQANGNVYLDEKFVGKGEVSNVAVGQIFTMGFGIDSQLRAKRELLDKKEKILGGNKEINFQVRISLDNYSKKTHPIRILDRIPQEDSKENYRITFDTKLPLSKEEIYERYERIKGILRWDLNLAPEVNAGKSKLIEYSYKMEFDKNLNINISTTQKEQEMKEEFMEIQKMRYKK